MILTERQIETLFKFTSYQGVEYYDLQVELVDHLASAIEEELNNNPALAPYDALQKVFAGFGKKGFKKVISEKEDLVRNGNKRILITMVKRHFTIPKLVFTTMLFLIIYSFSGYINPLQRYYVFLYFIVICLFTQSFFIGFLWKNCQKKLLLTIHNNLFKLINFPIINYVFFVMHDAIGSEIYFAAFITAFAILTAAAMQLNQQLKAKATALYPGAFLFN